MQSILVLLNHVLEHLDAFIARRLSNRMFKLQRVTIADLILQSAHKVSRVFKETAVASFEPQATGKMEPSLRGAIRAELTILLREFFRPFGISTRESIFSGSHLSEFFLEFFNCLIERTNRRRTDVCVVDVLPLH